MILSVYLGRCLFGSASCFFKLLFSECAPSPCVQPASCHISSLVKSRGEKKGGGRGRERAGMWVLHLKKVSACPGNRTFIHFMTEFKIYLLYLWQIAYFLYIVNKLLCFIKWIWQEINYFKMPGPKLCYCKCEIGLEVAFWSTPQYRNSQVPSSVETKVK